MPTIVVGNPKGGSGKSTTALVLGLTLAGQGAAVTLIDADANHPLTTWHDGRPRQVEVIGGLTDETFVSTLDREAARRDAVIVDLEGAATRIVSRAIMRADLVLIPTRAERKILEEMSTGGIPSLKTHLHERAAYKALFEYKAALVELDPMKVNGLAAALANAETFTDEVIVLLKSIVRGKAAA